MHKAKPLEKDKPRSSRSQGKPGNRRESAKAKGRSRATKTGGISEAHRGSKRIWKKTSDSIHCTTRVWQMREKIASHCGLTVEQVNRAIRANIIGSRGSRSNGGDCVR